MCYIVFYLDFPSPFDMKFVIGKPYIIYAFNLCNSEYFSKIFNHEMMTHKMYVLNYFKIFISLQTRQTIIVKISLSFITIFHYASSLIHYAIVHALHKVNGGFQFVWYFSKINCHWVDLVIMEFSVTAHILTFPWYILRVDIVLQQAGSSISVSPKHLLLSGPIIYI